jgi:hypothetical protein
MKSLTRSHNSSVSSHDLIPLPAILFILPLLALSYLRISPKDSWYYGALKVKNRRPYIVPRDEHDICFKAEPETVGEYIGLKATDSNRDRIVKMKEMKINKISCSVYFLLWESYMYTILKFRHGLRPEAENRQRVFTCVKNNL